MFESTQKESEEQTATSLYQMVNNIGHAIMNGTYILTYSHIIYTLFSI